jgi:hypothetical protein
MPKPKKAKAPKKDYVGEVQKFDWPQLRTLWQQIEARKTPGWPTGKAFEHLVLRAFELDGARVTWPYSVIIEGQIVEQIDGLVISDGISFLAESKDYEGNLNVEPLAKLRNQLQRRPAGVVGCVFSSTGFTAPAKTLAQYMSPQAVLLWQGPEIKDLLDKGSGFRAALVQKHYWLVREGIPDYDTRTDTII